MVASGAPVSMRRAMPGSGTRPNPNYSPCDYAFEQLVVTGDGLTPLADVLGSSGGDGDSDDEDSDDGENEAEHRQTGTKEIRDLSRIR